MALASNRRANSASMKDFISYFTGMCVLSTLRAQKETWARVSERANWKNDRREETRQSCVLHDREIYVQTRTHARVSSCTHIHTHTNKRIHTHTHEQTRTHHVVGCCYTLIALNLLFELSFSPSLLITHIRTIFFFSGSCSHFRFQSCSRSRSRSRSRFGFRPCSQYLSANTHEHIPVFRVKYTTLFHHALADWFLWHWKDRLRRCQWNEKKFTVSNCWEHNNTEYYHTRNHHDTYSMHSNSLALAQAAIVAHSSLAFREKSWSIISLIRYDAGPESWHTQCWRRHLGILPRVYLTECTTTM